MRIISGEHRGRRIIAPPGRDTRPTTDRAREALFNVIEHAAWAPRLRGSRVGDLFAGSGALGLEALSRGAVHVVFVERSAAAAEVIATNLRAMGLSDRALLLRADASQMPVLHDTALDLVFLDPPYGAGLLEPALASLTRGGWLRATSVVAAEHPADEPQTAQPGYELIDARRWGAAQVSFLRPVL